MRRTLTRPHRQEKAKCILNYQDPCTYLKIKDKNLFIRSLNTGRCYVCSNDAFVGVFWYVRILTYFLKSHQVLTCVTLYHHFL